MTKQIANRITGGLTTQEVSNLRNGRVEEVAPAIPRATIPEIYKWATIENLQNTRALESIDAVYRSYAVALAGETHAREMAIVLAVGRAITQAAWQISDHEFAVAEIVASGLEVQDGITRYINLTTDPATAAMANIAPLTPLEISVIPFIAWMATPVLALNGLSLVETGHHYLPTTAKYFASTKSQVLKSAPGEVADWLNNLGSTLDDVMFHKMCHPISVEVKVAVARDANTPERLRAASCGAAAVRLPASVGEVKAAKATLAIMNRAMPVIRSMEGSVDTQAIAYLIAQVQESTTVAERRAAVAALNGALEVAGPNIAYCYGVACAELDAAGMVNHSLTKSFFLKRKAQELTTDFNEGMMIYRAYKTQKAEALANGDFTARHIR
jgi:hypothetical protein